jgi:hypothetical protein
LTNRQEYKQRYYLDNKKRIIKQAKQYYKENRKECLQDHRKYYKNNREALLAKKKMKALTFKGHAHSIWRAVKKYAKIWDLPICEFNEFYDDWTADDPNYQELFDQWNESGHNEMLSPVCMRKIKKHGFVPSNLKWDKKQNYSWWNEDAKIFREVSDELEEQQKQRNKRSKEWRKKIREQFKEQQKAKKEKK